MRDNILTRMGDGERISMTAEELKDELLLGTRDAAQKGSIPELSTAELDQLFDIIADPSRIVSVAPGEELVVTDDGVAGILAGGEADGGAGLPISGQNSILAYERAFAPDTVSTGLEDYSFKPVKAVIDSEMHNYYSTSQVVTVPFFYGAQPNLGLYYQKDGPFPNPADLLPKGKIKEAQEAQEAAAEQLKNDIVFVGKSLYKRGCEGLNFDTTASAGDPDFYATLQAIVELKKAAPNMAVEVGMASEFVLGMHGQMYFNGERLAGLYPHKQVKVAESAGADIFGPAINVNTTKSCPWNLVRAVTFVKETVAAADIPVHPNVGMGVCGVPMCVETPIDCVTRASKALALIGKADGL